MPHTLHIDDRERAVSPFIVTQSRVVERLTVGDYAISWHGPNNTQRLVAVFERKTYEDYAASMKDGRDANVTNLLDARAKTGCHIYYIIEGDTAYPDDDRQFARIRYGHIRTSIRNLESRYGIMIIKTRNELMTATELTEKIRSYDYVEQSGSYEASMTINLLYKPNPDLILKARTNHGVDVDLTPLLATLDTNFKANDPTEGISSIIVRPNIHHHTAAGQVHEIIKGAVEHNVQEDIYKSRTAIPGLGVAAFQTLAHLSMREILMMTDKQLASLRHPTSNRVIPADLRLIILSLSSTREYAVKFLSGIRFVTPTIAEDLISAKNLLQLAMMTTDELMTIPVRRTANAIKRTKLSNQLAGRIHDCLQMRVINETNQPTQHTEPTQYTQITQTTQHTQTTQTTPTQSVQHTEPTQTSSTQSVQSVQSVQSISTLPSMPELSVIRPTSFYFCTNPCNAAEVHNYHLLSVGIKRFELDDSEYD
jgi:ERCC4-type nuclease